MMRSGFLRKVLVFSFVAGSLAAGSVYADEAGIRKAFEEKFPEAKVDKITKTDFGGLYEVFVQDQVVYTDANGSFLLQGTLIDLKSGKNVTSERRSELSKINFDDLPLNLAFKTVKGNGKRKMAVFSDPDCPFCRRLENDLAKVTDVTIYTFLFPIDSLHPQAREKAKAIWCAPDRVKAWNDYMATNATPNGPTNCDTPLAKIADLGEKYKINGTPTIFFANGRKVPGAVPAEQLEQMLNAATK